MQLSKHHGLGNDFLVVLDEVNGRALAITGDDAVRLCERRTGIGADGLLHGSAPATDPDAGPDVTLDADVVMRLFNADGSRAEMSGNGIRCFGQAVAAARGITAGTLRVLTDDGIKVLEIEPGGVTGEVLVSVDMGTARPGPAIPEGLDLPGRHHTVDMVNPHLVVEVPDPWAVDVAEVGAAIERRFPDGVNVEFIAARGSDHLDLAVWERGAGVTRACGTGACAAASVASGWGLVGHDVVVTMPGGDATVELTSDGRLQLTGPSVLIASLEVDASASTDASVSSDSMAVSA